MRRSLFFLIAALAAFAMIPVIQPDLQYVPTGLGIVYVVLSAMSALDSRSRR
ncbi:MAG: hypothetical protein ABIM89_11950 [Mycobacteriales bacterium]